MAKGKGSLIDAGGMTTEPTLPRPPNKPDDLECCHRGCCPCIFDYYYDAMERWEAVIEARGLDPKEVLKSMGRER